MGPSLLSALSRAGPNRCVVTVDRSKQPQVGGSSGLRRLGREEGPIVAPDGPSDPRELVRECNGGLVVTALSLAFERPGAKAIVLLRPLLLGVAEGGASAVDQEHTQIGIAPFADAAE